MKYVLYLLFLNSSIHTMHKETDLTTIIKVLWRDQKSYFSNIPVDIQKELAQYIFVIQKQRQREKEQEAITINLINANKTKYLLNLPDNNDPYNVTWRI